MLQDKKGQKRHQQVAGEIKSQLPGRMARSKARHADEKIAGVSDARIGKKPFEIGLRHRGEIAVNQREAARAVRTMRSLASMLGMTKNGSRTLRSTAKPAAFDADGKKGRDRSRRALIDVWHPELKRHCGDLESQRDEHQTQSEEHRHKIAL